MPFVNGAVVQEELGIPFSWTLGGSIWETFAVRWGAVALLFPTDVRRWAVGALLLDGGTSLIVNGCECTPTATPGSVCVRSGGGRRCR